MGFLVPSFMACRNGYVSLHFSPLLRIVADIASLCIPLKPTEEEEDVDKAQKLEEMIIILREVSFILPCLSGS